MSTTYSKSSKALLKRLMLFNNQSLEVELDTGASYSVIDYDVYRSKFPELQLNSKRTAVTSSGTNQCHRSH
jgi:hypothetical protein